MLNPNPERSQMARLRNKTLDLLECAIHRGDIVPGVNSTYLETDSDEEVTVYPNGKVHISSDRYDVAADPNSKVWFSILIGKDGASSDVLGIIEKVEDGKIVQTFSDIPKHDHDRLANFLLVDMFDRPRAVTQPDLAA